MERKMKIHIGAEVDPDLWGKFRKKAFAENLTAGQLLDKLIAAYLEIKHNDSQEAPPSGPAILLEDIAFEHEALTEEDVENET